MKDFYIILCLFITSVIMAQSQISVTTTGDRKPISNASVLCNGKLLGKTNSQGILNFKTRCKSVDVKAPGFYEDEAVVDKVMEIGLEKADKSIGNIEKIVLKDQSDPRALAILKKVNEEFKNNSPLSLDAYAFKSYEKISFDLDEDTIKTYSNYVTNRIDSLKTLPPAEQKSKERKDSIEAQNVLEMIGESKLFLWERAQEFAFSKKFGEKITVLDNRVSGINEPIYEMMTLRSNRNKMPKEVAEENHNLYRYFLSDTIEIEGRQNYVIRFRQVTYREPINRRKFNGYIYIDKDTYGIKKIESNGKVKSEGSITSVWIPINNKWFLQKENMKVKAGSMAFSENPEGKQATEDHKSEKEKQKRTRFGYYVYRTADYFDHQANIPENSKDFKGYTMEVENSDGKQMDQYRTGALTDRELNTYTKIDSVGRKYKLNQKANLVAGFLKGKIRVGNIDLDAGQFAKYNLYEGFRLGVGAKLNEKFHKYISPDAYIAYGFKDGALKYGAGIDVKTTLEKNSFFRAEYYNDVLAAGRFNENLWNFRMKFMNSGVDLKNDRFYAYEGVKVSYENDLLNSLTMRVSAARDTEEAKFAYNFNNLGNQFKHFSTMVTLKYAPKSKNIMTPSGKYTFEQNFPEFYFNFEKGFKTLDGDFDFTKFDLLTAHRFKSKIGITGIRTYAGILSGEAPIWHHFQMNGLGSGKPEFNFNLTSYLGFATMEAGRYYNDRFAGYYLTHRIPRYFKSFGQNASSFDLIYRGIIGDMKRPELHQFDFQTLTHLYQEAGLEWNNFLSSKFNLGFFYRIGHYKTANFKENFAVQLKLNILGF